MKAWAVVEAGQPLQHIDLLTPEPTGTEVLLAVTHCGVCHSDLHFWHGHYNLGGGKVMRIQDRGVTLPRAPGHEIVGRVVGLGPDAVGVSVGDLRIVYPWIGCGRCDRCRDGDDNLCTEQHSLGVIQHGGFASHVVAPHPRYLVDPGAVDPAVAATYACSGITVYGAVRKALPMPPDYPIVLIGAGGLGLSAIAMLKALGHQNIISVDIATDKRQAALDAGATAVVDGTAPDLTQAILAAAGGQVRAVIDFVNNDATGLGGFGALAKGGKFIAVGVSGGELTVSLSGMVFRGLSVQGSLTGSPQDLRDVIALAESGRLKPLPVERLPKDAANDAMARLDAGMVTGRLVLVAE
ncbi:MAG TPA: alcohol dehydrogenase [Alphaproteobacteria bacterium]|nr:alcohol dehydrogenase [Alphaproteobacteria bacterium]